MFRTAAWRTNELLEAVLAELMEANKLMGAGLTALQAIQTQLQTDFAALQTLVQTAIAAFQTAQAGGDSDAAVASAAAAFTTIDQGVQAINASLQTAFPQTPPAPPTTTS